MNISITRATPLAKCKLTLEFDSEAEAKLLHKLFSNATVTTIALKDFKILKVNEPSALATMMGRIASFLRTVL